VTSGRTPLVVAVSYDNGATWPDRLTLADASEAVAAAPKRQLSLSTDGLTKVEVPGEYSYPAIIPTADGAAITYTYDRQHIQFARFSLEHLRGRTNVEVAPGVGHHESRDWLQWFTRG
jgi:predicted neuraminidase